MTSKAGDVGFQQPFYAACVAALDAAWSAGSFNKLPCSPTFAFAVEISTGDHSDAWRPDVERPPVV